MHSATMALGLLLMHCAVAIPTNDHASLAPTQLIAVSGCQLMYPAVSLVAGTSTQEVFNDIYKNGKWGLGGRGSGSGSDASFARGAAKIIFDIMLAHNLTTLVDAPCGAMEWQQHLIPSLRLCLGSGFHYHGVDVVPQVVSDNEALFAKASDVTFSLADLSEPATTLPGLDSRVTHAVALTVNCLLRCRCPHSLCAQAHANERPVALGTGRCPRSHSLARRTPAQLVRRRLEDAFYICAFER